MTRRKGNKQLLRDTMALLEKYNMTCDVNLFVDGLMYTTYLGHSEQAIDKLSLPKSDITWYAIEREAQDVLGDYCNPKTLSITFEGDLYLALNAWDTDVWQLHMDEKLSDIFAKYGLYYEMGYAWSLSTYEI